ncbi:MAG: hypothetical protein IT305_32955 [Chloroflexi bacterium]|nr:hypothetical protein [Chloroflexota bacterium]
MEQDPITSGAPVVHVAPIELVREGMDVVDVTGKKIGTVEGLKMGDPGAITDAGNELPQPDFIGDIAMAMFGDEREPDVPPALRARLLRTGFVKIDGPGLLDQDRYVRADMIASVEGDTVRLLKAKDQLIEEI